MSVQEVGECQDVQTIRLADGQTTLVDSVDYERFASSRWRAVGGSRTRPNRYVGRRVNVDGVVRFELLHRLIVDAPKGLEVDHINGDPLDNRRANLRIVTHAQNLQNLKGANANSTTGVRGVCLTRNGMFTARIKHLYRERYLGTFKTLEEAAQAARAARLAAFPYSEEDKVG